MPGYRVSGGICEGRRVHNNTTMNYLFYDHIFGPEPTTRSLQDLTCHDLDECHRVLAPFALQL